MRMFKAALSVRSGGSQRRRASLCLRSSCASPTAAGAPYTLPHEDTFLVSQPGICCVLRLLFGGRPSMGSPSLRTGAPRSLLLEDLPGYGLSALGVGAALFPELSASGSGPGTGWVLQRHCEDTGDRYVNGPPSPGKGQAWRSSITHLNLRDHARRLKPEEPLGVSALPPLSGLPPKIRGTWARSSPGSCFIFSVAPHTNLLFPLRVGDARTCMQHGV